ncbi:hypothetical protein BGX31_005102, partial [Mortierella sp. GBA43]
MMKFLSAVLVISVVVAVVQVAAIPVSPPNDIDPVHVIRRRALGHLPKPISRYAIASVVNSANLATVHRRQLSGLLGGLDGGDDDDDGGGDDDDGDDGGGGLLGGISGGGGGGGGLVGGLPIVGGISQTIVGILCGSDSPDSEEDQEEENAGATIGCIVNATETTRVLTEKLKQIRDSKSTDKVIQRAIEKLVHGASKLSAILENISQFSTSALAEIE